MKGILSSILFLFISVLCIAQNNENFEAYVFEENNRGFLNQVKVSIFELPYNALIGEYSSDETGKVTATLNPGRSYRINCRKDVFIEHNDTIQMGAEKSYLKISMKRKPGYLFDMTLAEARTKPDQEVDAIDHARVEIYNNTRKKMELEILDHPSPYLQFTFEQGNHYTILIRKQGFLAKRIEAHVNIDGCIICIDGVNDLRPGVTENLTSDMTMGTLLANISMDRIEMQKKVAFNNITYPKDKWDISTTEQAELDKIAAFIRLNPQYLFEFSAHTDSRGDAKANMELSKKRATAAVNYLKAKDIPVEQLYAKGYGESKLKNKCADGVPCSEDDHAQNRRTELTIVGYNKTFEALQPLTEIKRLEQMEKTLAELQSTEEVKIPTPTATTKPETTTPKTSTPLPVSIVNHSEEFAELPAQFSGFTIQVHQSDKLLGVKDPIFKGLSPLMVKKDAKGVYHYYMSGFPNQSSASNYLNAVVLQVKKDARLCKCEQGNCIFAGP